MRKVDSKHTGEMKGWGASKYISAPAPDIFSQAAPALNIGQN